MAADGLTDLVTLPQMDAARYDEPFAPAPAIRIWPGSRPTLMRPVWIDGSFGWLHAGASSAGSDTAVLICPPVSWDTLRSHHPLRLLAEGFAQAGYPTLRLSYPGTGNARDLAPGEEHWATWQACVAQAADWLRGTTGATRLVFAGLRLGATLATVVSQTRDDVAGLLLLAPVLRGKSYMRQLSVEAQMENRQSVNLEDGLDFLELDLSATSVARIGAVDLRQARLRPGLHVAIFQSVATRLEDECTSAWIARGAHVLRGSFDGLESMLLQTLDEDPPPLEPKVVIDWLCDTVPASYSNPKPVLPAAKPVMLPHCTETAVQFGADAGLSGILCQPPCDSAAMGPGRAVIIVNTGRDPSYGIARFGVKLARRLAAEGIASLRFDFAGLGDSVGASGDKNALSALLAADRSSDVSAAVDLLLQHGYHDIGVHGLCSGAYHAFHAGLADARINTLLLVNFPVFRWQNVRLLVAPRHYLLQLLDGPSWGRLWRGEIKFRSIVAAQKARIWDRVQAVAKRPAASLLQSFPYRAMDTLSQRRVRTLFLFAAGDQGLEAINQAFGRLERGITMFEGVAVRIVPGLDHVLTARRMRETVADLIIRFLSSEEGPATAPGNPAPATRPAHQPPAEIAAERPAG